MPILITPPSDPSLEEALAINVLIKNCLLRMGTSRMFIVTDAVMDGLDIGSWEIVATQTRSPQPKPPNDPTPEPDPTPNPDPKVPEHLDL